MIGYFRTNELYIRHNHNEHGGYTAKGILRVLFTITINSNN